MLRPNARLTITLIAAAACTLMGQSRPAVSRIVSTSPSTTEMLFALGLGDRVVAVSSSCRYPPQVRSLPKIGNVLHPDFERILTLHPDLVVVNDRLPEVAERLGAANLPVVAVGITTLADVSTAMLRIGEAAGIGAHARDVVDAIDDRLEQVRRRTPAGPRPRVLLIMGRTPGSLRGMIAAGAGSYLNDLVAIAGGVNVVAETSALPYPQVSLESVLHLNPDVIVDTVDMGETEIDRLRRNTESRQLWKPFATVSAVRSKRVRAAETDALFIPGPRVVDVAEWLARVIHGDAQP
jgi:iron complex transport system substrate-binding protein